MVSGFMSVIEVTSSQPAIDPHLQREVLKRRTFAIISHPDAGKTTLTEKLLLYGGAVNLAGSVTARKNQRATTSDWMELEKQRGISVSSTVLQFEYGGCVINLLDTPGHKDFSEDTYRVLTAVDAAVMVIDAGKGIEAQTRKLFEVCRLRGVPIFTFMNKMDRPSRPPLELLDELESVLSIQAMPLNWPLGDGPEFRGVFDRETKQVHLFERTSLNAYRAPVAVRNIEDELVRATLDPGVYRRVCEELSLLEGAGSSFDFEAVQTGALTPVFFGSAANNFGVQLLMDRFLELAPPPAARKFVGGTIQATQKDFSGFVFKIQANMNPKHRDRVAFIRIVSGTFERDMMVINTRTEKRIRLSNSQRLFARERETIDTAFAGDVVGIVGNHDFLMGDTLAERPDIHFDEIPRFAPECFAYLHNTSSAKFKRFREGLEQLLKEGLAQSFETPGSYQNVPLLGAVGPLQFDVLKYRLESEYGAECRVEMTDLRVIRWMKPLSADDVEGKAARPKVPTGAKMALDAFGSTVMLLPDAWAVKSLEAQNKDWAIEASPFKKA
jgi:peptide chain release factor 3